MSNKNVRYDPLPPYDLNDIEASSATPQPQDADTSAQVPENEVQLGENVVELHEERHGRMSQRECCRWAFLYFFTAIVALVIVIPIVARRK
jgi:hypothetical protein